MPDEFFGFWDQTSTIQFCGFIDRPFEFHPSDTLVRVRIRDIAGNLSDEAQIIIRVPLDHMERPAHDRSIVGIANGFPLVKEPRSRGLVPEAPEPHTKGAGR